MVYFYKREPEDEVDQQLLDEGWEFAGTALFKHPKLYNGDRFFTKQKAMEEGMGVYCQICGACGETGCCSPDVCKCVYVDDYRSDYKTMESDCEKLLSFVARLIKPGEYVDKYILAGQAKEIINSLGDNNEHST